jgi:hypothetical protein
VDPAVDEGKVAGIARRRLPGLQRDVAQAAAERDRGGAAEELAASKTLHEFTLPGSHFPVHGHVQGSWVHVTEG